MRVSLLVTSILVCASSSLSAEDERLIDVLMPTGEWVRASSDERGVIRSAAGIDVGSGALAWSPTIENRAAGSRAVFSMARLANGQVLVGTFGGFHETERGSIARWKHPGLGLIDVPIDATSLIQLHPMAVPPKAVDSDEIVLRNGDRVRGYVKTFGDPIVLESAGMQVEVPIERAAGIALVSQQGSSEGIRVWLSEGSIIDGSTISGGFQGAFVLNGAVLIGRRSALPLLIDEIVCVAMEPERIFPLAKLKAKVALPTVPALVRAEYPQPTVAIDEAPLGASAIEVRGPERLIYEIPKGFTVLSAQAEIPLSLRAWGDCTVVVRQGNQELGRFPLNAKSPVAQITAAIQQGPLEIEIEEGGGGPIGDTVILRRAILIAAKSAN